MSASFEIQSSTGSYRVTIENGLFQKVVDSAAQKTGLIFIADEYFLPVFQKAGVDAITLASAETTKSLDAMPAIITEMRRRGANRQTELLAIGGGIVQDVAAFVASVFMRGIAWKYVPTTVLAMADSCIGGKSSINVGPYKNLVGTFHPPLEILIDPLLTDSLTPEQRSAGLIEAAKICYCRGEREFADYLAFEAGPHMPGEALEPLLTTSLMSKKWFIETDEFDQAERLLLNFGHTFGHAIEGAAHFRISHGIAVAVGILCALEYRKAAGDPDTPRVIALETHMHHLASASPGLKAELEALSVTDIVERFQADKKHNATHYTLILPSAEGNIALTRHEKSDPVRQRIGAAVTAAIGSLA